MNKLFKKALALAAFAACTAASAGTVTFNDLTPVVYFDGETISQGDVTLTTVGGFGAAVNGATTSSCDIAVCPSGNSSIYYAGLNDSILNLAINGGTSIGIKSLDFSFISPAPIPGLAGYGYLVLQGLFADGSSLFSTADLNTASGTGGLSFVHWDVSGALAIDQFASVNVFACLFDGNGFCVNPSGEQAQFAVDNIEYVPEPATLALVGLGVFGIAATRRRQSV